MQELFVMLTVLATMCTKQRQFDQVEDDHLNHEIYQDIFDVKSLKWKLE